MATDNLHAGGKSLTSILDDMNGLLLQATGVVCLLAENLDDFESDAAWAASTMLGGLKEKLNECIAIARGSVE